MVEAVPTTRSQQVGFRAAQPEDDPMIAQHFYQLWRDNEVAASDLIPDWQATTLRFIAQARAEFNFCAFIAEADQQIIGSASCQKFAGLYPLILTPTYRNYGYIWGVYIESAYRRQGFAKHLTQLCLDYLTSLDCTRAILHASPSGKPVYTQLGFIESNEMRLDLHP
jgi:ribosomal protein S18 acetylase RimI-like enzyme